MTRLEILKTAYADNLAETIALRPELYAWPVSELPAVTARMLASLDRYRGISGCNIDSPAWKRTAKQLGVKNTRKAWTAWLAGEVQS